MELHPEQGQGAVRKAHHGPVLGHAVHLIVLRQGLLPDHERVIPGHVELPGQPGEEAGAVVVDPGDLAVHGAHAFLHRGPGAVAQHLVAQAHPQQGNFSAEALHGVHAQLGVPGALGAGGEDDALGLHGLDVVQGKLVRAPD